MSGYDKAVDGADRVSKVAVAAKSGGASDAAEGAAASGMPPAGSKGFAGKAGSAALNKVDGVVHSAIDKSVESQESLGKPKPRTRVGQALREDRKAITKGALGGAYEGLKVGGWAGAAWEGGRGAAVAALRSNTAHAIVGSGAKVAVALGAGALLTAIAFITILILVANLVISNVQASWQYQAGERAMSIADSAWDIAVNRPAAVARAGVLRAKDAAAMTANSIEWTVGFAVDRASGLYEEVVIGESESESESDERDAEQDGDEDSTAEETAEPTADPSDSAMTPVGARVAKSVVEKDGIYFVDGQEISTSPRYGVPRGQPLPPRVLLLTTAAATPSAEPTGEPTDEPSSPSDPTADPTDEPTGEATEEPADDETEAPSDTTEPEKVEPGGYKIDVEKAEELGLTQEQYEDSEYMSRFIASYVGKRVAELGREDGRYPSLNNGVLLDHKGVGFVADDSADRNQKTREIYEEAISELPIEGIEEKSAQIVQEAARLWMGQTCGAPGAGGDGSGEFTGEGVPEHAIPWIEHSASKSKYRIPAAFFAFIADQETGFREDVGHVPDSNGGTRGLYQMNQMLWKEYYGHPWGADLNNNGKPDENEGMIVAEVGAKYFDARLETVRGIRKKHPGKPLAKDLTELEALLIAHNAGEKRLLSYPRIPSVTKKYLSNYREKFEKYGGGEPSSSEVAPGGGGGSGSGSGSSSSGLLVKPQGEWPKTSDRGHRWGRFHAGTDYGVPSGTPLPAMFDGIVTFSGSMNGYGNILMVKGSWEGQELGYAYAHMTSSKVKVGQQVKAGDLIGISGNTGVGTGPHLHLELRTSGFAAPGTQHNTADAHKFLESNGAQIVGNPTTPDGDAGNGEQEACAGGNDTPTGAPDGIPNEKCDGNAGKIEEGLAPNGVNVLRAICGSFPEVKHWSGRRQTSIIGSKSDHFTGHAVDAMVNHSGSNDSELGTRISEYLIENADSLNVRYIIWEQRIWHPGRDWKKMRDRRDDTQNHLDHVHVSVNK